MASEPSVLVARCNGPTTNSRRLFNPSEVHTTRFRYAFREQRPEDGITTAWVNLTFIDNNGRSAEVDVLLMTRAGIFVVELKGWHGTIHGNSQRWQDGTRNGTCPTWP